MLKQISKWLSKKSPFGWFSRLGDSLPAMSQSQDLCESCRELDCDEAKRKNCARLRTLGGATDGAPSGGGPDRPEKSRDAGCSIAQVGATEQQMLHLSDGAVRQIDETSESMVGHRLDLDD